MDSLQRTYNILQILIIDTYIYKSYYIFIINTQTSQATTNDQNDSQNVFTKGNNFSAASKVK